MRRYEAIDARQRQLQIDLRRARFLSWKHARGTDGGTAAPGTPAPAPALHQDRFLPSPHSHFASLTAQHLAGDISIACTTIMTEQMATVDLVQEVTSSMVGMVLISSDKHMDKTPSQAACSRGNCSTPLVLAATTTPNGATLATGEPVSTFCVANAPGENCSNKHTHTRPPSAEQPTPSASPSGAFFNLPSPNLDGATSTCANTGPIYAAPPPISQVPHCSAVRRRRPVGGPLRPPRLFRVPCHTRCGRA